jgi:glycolate oxidase iron-sulfur subunit
MNQEPLGAAMPEGVRFVGPATGSKPGWHGDDHPDTDDIATCVACGLCLPHCPTYQLTQEETASPRGRIAAMRAIDEGRAQVGAAFMSITDLCLSCRACEDVCPSNVPFGRMIEGARAQVEPLRQGAASRARAFGLTSVIRRNWLLDAVAALAPLAKPLLPKRVKRLVPRSSLNDVFTRLPRSVEPAESPRGTVALLRGCVQDRWFRDVNEATLRVLVRNGWRVVVPPQQVCCGALSAHYGHGAAARDMARTNIAAFDGVDFTIVNSAGCSAHVKEYGELLGGELRAGDTSRKVRDLLEFLAEQGIEPPTRDANVGRVAYHDPCHATHAQGIRAQPRELLSRIPGLDIVEIPDGDTCCGAAGLYNVLQPAMSDELGRNKADAIAATGARVIASANPGCSMQIAAYMRERGEDVEVLHPVQLLDRAYRASGWAT